MPRRVCKRCGKVEMIRFKEPAEYCNHCRQYLAGRGIRVKTTENKRNLDTI